MRVPHKAPVWMARVVGGRGNSRVRRLGFSRGIFLLRIMLGKDIRGMYLEKYQNMFVWFCRQQLPQVCGAGFSLLVVRLSLKVGRH